MEAFRLAPPLAGAAANLMSVCKQSGYGAVGCEEGACHQSACRSAGPIDDPRADSTNHGELMICLMLLINHRDNVRVSSRPAGIAKAYARHAWTQCRHPFWRSFFG